MSIELIQHWQVSTTKRKKDTQDAKSGTFGTATSCASFNLQTHLPCIFNDLERARKSSSRSSYTDSSFVSGVPRPEPVFTELNEG